MLSGCSPRGCSPKNVLGGQEDIHNQTLLTVLYENETQRSLTKLISAKGKTVEVCIQINYHLKKSAMTC